MSDDNAEVRGTGPDAGNPETDLLKRDEIYRGVVVNLRVDSIRLPSGRTAVREVIHHPGGVVVLPVLDDGRIVLVRQFRYALGKFILELPAGKLDLGKPPMETIRIELEEEAGCRAGSIRPLFDIYTTPGICDEVIHCFVADGLTPVDRRPEEGEHMTVEAYTPQECIRMIEAGEIPDAKTIVGILWHCIKTGVRG
jgi:ADP-ribose pyrophosphatase